jgi:four helix bundle protein
MEFTKLRVWQRAHQWVLAIYRVTKEFPPEERFGLTAQLRRAASGVPSNVAEGSKRGSDADYARFIRIAHSSCAEAQYQLMLAKDLGYLADVALIHEADAIGGMLFSLRASVAPRRSPRRQAAGGKPQAV